MHQCNLKDYIRKFGKKDCGLISSSRLPKNDPKYIKWRDSLRKRPAPWNKGLTKRNHASVAKISKTFKRKKIDNFSEWRKKMIVQGKFQKEYPPLEKSADLAELIGVILGDGYVGKFPRTEVLRIFSNANNPGFVNRYAKLIKKIFNKQPYVKKRSYSNYVDITIYQKDISKRLNISVGSKRGKEFKIPRWIARNKERLIRYLRGLYEADGSFSIHKPTCTYKLIFSNINQSLLDNVYQGLKVLGFNPHTSKHKVQLSRKAEVYKFKDLIQFRHY